MAESEFERFRKWMMSLGATPDVMRTITPTTYKKHPYYSQWKAVGSPLKGALSQVISPTAPTTAVGPATLITTEQYLTGYERFLRSQLTEDEGMPVYADEQIDQLLSDALNTIDTRGLEVAPGYAEIVAQYADLAGLGDILNKPEGLDDYEKAQIALATQQMQQDLEYRQGQLGMQREELAWRREEAGLPYGGMTAYQERQAGLSEQELAIRRAEVYAQYSGHGDWIKRWYLDQAMRQAAEQRGRGGEYGQVPWVDWTKSERQQYQQTQTTPGGYQVPPGREWLMQAPQQGQMVTADPETLQAGFIDPAEHQRALAEREAMVAPTKVTVSPTGEVSITTPSGAPPGATGWGGAALQGGARSGMTGGMRGQTYAGVTGPYAEAPKGKKKPKAGKPQPTTPPTPPWLTKFTPWLTPGQPITRGPTRGRIKEGVAPRGISPPSGQLWAGTLPSERAGLGGFLEWAGGRGLGDIEAQMAMMRPRTPAGVYGRQWRPARQRV